jgi:hypothetical protein
MVYVFGAHTSPISSKHIFGVRFHIHSQPYTTSKYVSRLLLCWLQARHTPYDRYWDQGNEFMTLVNLVNLVNLVTLVNLCTKLLIGCGYYTVYGI